MPCRAVLVVVLSMAACSPSPGPTPSAPAARPVNVLLITLDTFRADRLGRGLTPWLDRLAAQSLRFHEARTVVPLTLPAHVSIMTGMLPPVHGARLNGTVAAADLEMLATRLRAAGYHTGAVVGAFVLDRRFGLARGFDDYDDDIARDPAAMDTLNAERKADAVVDRAIAMLGRAPAAAQWLQWVHLYDAHAPYEPPASALTHARGNAYDGEIAFVDAQVGRLLAAIEVRPDAAHTVVLVVGDHGEGLGEHGEATHGMQVFEPTVRVPLLVRAPGLAPADRRDLASVVDVAPTVLALAGVTAPALDGRNLLAEAPADLVGYAESEYPTAASWTPVAALVRGSWKLVMGDRAQLFDLSTDGTEREDRVVSEPARARELTARLQALRRRAAATSATTAPPSPETTQRLRALGYVATSTRFAPTGATPPTAMRDWAAFEAALTDSRGGRSRQALPVFASLAAAHPRSPLFAATYARTLAATGATREALSRFRSAVAEWPDDWSLFHELATVARDVGRTAEALRAEDAALVLSPDEPTALNGKGLLLSDLERHADAAQAFDLAVARDPTNATYLANLGNARRATGDLDRAADAYRRALARAPALADAANGLGVVLVQQQRAAEALPWLEQAARDPAFGEAQLNLGIALQQAGQVDRAVRQYRQLAAGRTPTREREAARTLLAQLEKR